MALDAISMQDAGPDHGFVYPESDDMVESSLQRWASALIIDLLRDYFTTLEQPVFVGGNQFFYYKPLDLKCAVAPDVYTIDGETMLPWELRSWKTWEHGGKGPTLALEIVSEESKKDYGDELLERYRHIGVREVIRFEPEARLRKTRERFAHWVRDGQGNLVRQLTSGDRVRSQSYDLWFVYDPRFVLRLGVGPKGMSLWPTAAERATAEAERAASEAERATAEAERAASEAERATAEAERAETEARRAAVAEAEVLRLRAELARLRGG